MYRAHHFPTLATCKYGKNDNNIMGTRTGDRVKPKTFLHENFLWPINYAHRVCPTFLSAAVEGLAVTASCMLILLALWMLFSVCSGVSKQLSKGERISSDRATSTAARSFDIFPSTSVNYREILKLRAAVARLEAENRARAAGAGAEAESVSSYVFSQSHLRPISTHLSMYPPTHL